MRIKKLHRCSCLTGYAELVRSLHVSPLEQLRRVDINPACLTNPDTKIPASALFQLLENSAQAAGVENFGLRLAEERQVSNLGPLAIVLRSQPTMRKALEAMRDYSHLQAEAIALSFEQNGDVLLIREELMLDRDEPIRQAVELSLGVIYRTLRALFGDEWRPTVICFRHSPPSDLSVHRRVFHSRLQFNSNIDGIICRAAALDRPLPSYDPESARYMQKLLGVMDTKPADSDAAKGKLD